ncbi:unnamed protein product, partial [Brachionus calyciflorus]
GPVFLFCLDDKNKTFIACDQNGKLKVVSCFNYIVHKVYDLKTNCSLMELKNQFLYVLNANQIKKYECNSYELISSNEVYLKFISKFTVSSDEKFLGIINENSKVSVYCNLTRKISSLIDEGNTIQDVKFNPKNSEYLLTVDNLGLVQIFSTKSMFLQRTILPADSKFICLNCFNSGTIFSLATSNKIFFYEFITWTRKFNLNLEKDDVITNILVSKNDTQLYVFSLENKAKIFDFITLKIIYIIELNYHVTLTSSFALEDGIILGYEDGRIKMIFKNNFHKTPDDFQKILEGENELENKIFSLDQYQFKVTNKFINKKLKN